MQYLELKLLRGMALPAMAVALVLGGCSGTMEKLSEMTPRASDFTTIDWNPYSRASSGTSVPRLTPSPATAADFINPDGSCAGAATRGADEEPTATVAPAGGPVGLQMTECSVVRALGTPEKVELGANERGDRKAVLLYSRGERPGLYTFTAGLLTAIDRVDVPEPPKPAKKPPPKPAPRRAT